MAKGVGEEVSSRGNFPAILGNVASFVRITGEQTRPWGLPTLDSRKSVLFLEQYI
jgi:hypothetical protein